MVSSSSLVTLLATSLATSLAGATTLITSDSAFFGQSPPSYPSPLQPGSATWASARSKALAFIALMTAEEKANITVGYTPLNGCSGVTGSVPRLNFTGLCLSDAGNGVRNADFVNAWPSGLHVGASWNRELAVARGKGMGGEFRKKGSNVALGPVVGPLGRMAEGGRNWEGAGNDPYHAGKLAADTVIGLQSAGVIASVKHFIGYEQETNRNPISNISSPGLPSSNSSLPISSVSSNIDDKAIHELYLWPFVDTVKAGAGCVMCAYNRINNSFACQNSKTMNDLLKTELGFEGFVVSDWGGQHGGIASADAGLDLAMPNSIDYWGTAGGNLTAGIANGSFSASRLDDMAVRILASWYQMGQDTAYPNPDIHLPLDLTIPHPITNARDPASNPILLQGAIEGHVLVKNVNKTLPLKKPTMLSVYGYDAIAPPIINPGVGVYDNPYDFGTYSYLAGANGVTFNQLGPLGAYAGNGTLWTGGGSGANAPPYISAPLDAIKEQAYKDDTVVYWDVHSTSPYVDQNSDACLVFVNTYAIEGHDRPNLHDDYSDSLVLNVAANCSNTIVTIHNAGIRLVDQWIAHPNITAVIFAHLPGQDSGRALVQLLYGHATFSGKLPYTVAKNESDYNVLSPSYAINEFEYFPQSDFSEGVFIDYRDFDQKNITPRFEFGFGLSYTSFAYAHLNIAPTPGVSAAYHLPNRTIIEGGAASLWDVLFSVQATITNTGSVAGAEISQLYVGIPGGPVRQLRGFSKDFVQVGANVTVGFELTRRDLSEWSVVEQAWVLPQGSYGVWVGASSRDLRLKATMQVGGS